MASDKTLRRAKARQKALTDLAKLYRSDYQRFYKKHLKALGSTPRATEPAPRLEPDCLHPKEDRKVFGYGTFCGLCNIRIR